MDLLERSECGERAPTLAIQKGNSHDHLPNHRFPIGATHSVLPGSPTGSDDVVVELFYADLKGCEPCDRAISETDEAARLLRDELAALGRNLTVRTVQLQDPGHAQALGIENPVTIRIDGTDIDPSPSGDLPAPCGVSGVAPTTCRSYEWDGQRFDAPPAELIVNAVHQYLDGSTRSPWPPHPDRDGPART